MLSDGHREGFVGKVPEILTHLLGVSKDIQIQSDERTGPDLVITASGKTFVIEFRQSTGAATIAAAARQLLAYGKQAAKEVVLLVAAPFMGEAGRRVCEDLGVGWIDLSGNAHVVASGLRIIVGGQPNRFLSAGRPPNLFAPKSSRVARWLLMHPDESLTQRELARAVDMGEGFVSRLVSRLEREGYVVRENGMAIRAKDPSLLLNAWQERYQFSRHMVHRGYIAARSGDALLRFLHDAFASQNVEYAATGLAAAWMLTKFVAFRNLTVYVGREPADELLKRLAFSEDPRGANTWLVVPNDKGVFHGAGEKEGIRCVHPVQAYLDLKDQPERAREAAERLRKEYLNWRTNG
jgi:hypothetical protein